MRRGLSAWALVALGGALVASCSLLRPGVRHQEAAPAAPEAPPAQFLAITSYARGEMFPCG